jgi:hypothetical protein
MDFSCYSGRDLSRYFQNTYIQVADQDFLFLVEDVEKSEEEEQTCYLWVKKIGTHDVMQVKGAEVIPWWPDTGYYNLQVSKHNIVVSLGLTAIRQWKKSYNGDTYRADVPNWVDVSLVDPDLVPPQEVLCDYQPLLRAIDKPNYPSYIQALDVLKDPLSYGVALSSDLAVCKYIYMEHPVVLLQNKPIGVLLQDSGVVELSHQYQAMLELVQQIVPEVRIGDPL